jgi:hypothetical protein
VVNTDPIATGYITLERNIVGLNPREIEGVLGLRAGELTTAGARILVLKRQPSVGEFAFAGSTWYPGAKGLVSLQDRRNCPIPNAWLHQRLVKVRANVQYPSHDDYPRSASPVEQWQLLSEIPADWVCTLVGDKPYWPVRVKDRTTR